VVGGGIDLTPHYIDMQEAYSFHDALRKICDRHDADYYRGFKAWADEYFFISHRNESRGVGGIFFDRLNEEENKHLIFDFVFDLGKSFVSIYQSLIDKKRDLPFTERHRAWQLLRRGRYVEFNLVLDRGTRFGLQTNGRIESILMSLPPMARWAYDYRPDKGTPEWETLQLLRKKTDWINA
jgi:coproporphyrinogen III oxidase